MCSAGEKENLIYSALSEENSEFTLPADTGIKIGQGFGSFYIVLWAHYGKKFSPNMRDYSGVTVHIVTEAPKFLAGIYSLSYDNGTIPSHLESNNT